MTEKKQLKKQLKFSSKKNTNFFKPVKTVLKESSLFEFFKKLYYKYKVNLKKLNKFKLYENKVLQTNFFLVCIILNFSLSIFLVSLVSEKLISRTAYVRISFSVLLFTILVGLFVLPYKMRNYGINLNRLKFNLLYGILISIITSGLAILLRFYLVKQNYLEYSFNPVPELDFFIYPISVFTQEEMARGFLQNYFYSIYDKTNFNKFLSIFFSSLIFGIMHIPYGYAICLLSSFFSILLGYFYHESRSILGVCIIHFFTGTALFYFSNISR